MTDRALLRDLGAATLFLAVAALTLTVWLCRHHWGHRPSRLR